LRGNDHYKKHNYDTIVYRIGVIPEDKVDGWIQKCLGLSPRDQITVDILNVDFIKYRKKWSQKSSAAVH